MRKQSVVRPAGAADLPEVLRLYAQLNPDDPPLDETRARTVFEVILGTPGMTLLVIDATDRLIATTYLNVVPNLSRQAAPYAVIENVVVDALRRGSGLGKRIMAATLEAAWDAGCYKAMLLTGSKRPSTLGFYRACGFVENEKTAYVAHPPAPRPGRSASVSVVCPRPANPTDQSSRVTKRGRRQ